MRIIYEIKMRKRRVKSMPKPKAKSQEQEKKEETSSQPNHCCEECDYWDEQRKQGNYAGVP